MRIQAVELELLTAAKCGATSSVRAVGTADFTYAPGTPHEPRGPRPLADRLAAGDLVGPYELMEHVGTGGYGSVYRARDSRLERDIALKVFHRHAEHRAAHEARAMAQLRHENIVSVHDVGGDHGHVYIAMEYVDGSTLCDWLANEDPDWRQILRAFLAAGRGLAAAHAKQIIHRDFKPANVLVGNDGCVRVIDFGLARADNDPDDEQAELPVGTREYMSPEQYRGESVDARTDQFSFAVSLYEALYGERPFRGGTMADVVRRIESGTVPSPSTTSSSLVALHAIIAKALSSDAADRFETMPALLARLECVLG